MSEDRAEVMDLGITARVDEGVITIEVTDMMSGANVTARFTPSEGGIPAVVSIAEHWVDILDAAAGLLQNAADEEVGDGPGA